VPWDRVASGPFKCLDRSLDSSVTPVSTNSVTAVGLGAIALAQFAVEAVSGSHVKELGDPRDPSFTREGTGDDVARREALPARVMATW
jgi:hypothetical protein